MKFIDPQFAAPVWLWLAVLAPLAFALLAFYAARARARQIDAIAEPELQPRLLRSHSPRRRALKHCFIALCLMAAGLALARPQWGRQIQESDLEGEDIMLVLDCSKSMLATDVRPNRLARAKLAIMDFVQGRPGGRVGLVAFAGQAFVQCPLTFDYDAFRECLMAVDEKTIPVQGTDIARALDEASSAMEKDARRKLIILVTDGEDLERAGLQKARELAEAGVVVYAVGVGTTEGRTLEIVNERGALEVLRDAKGQAVVSRLDDTTLRAIAGVTGGTYQPLGTVGQGFIQIREALQSGSVRAHRGAQTVGIDRFYWFVAAVLGLMVVESLIGTRRRMSENLNT
jgi:Ca-activated chloride channel homolog